MRSFIHCLYFICELKFYAHKNYATVDVKTQSYLYDSLNVEAVNCKLSDLSECLVHFSNSFFVDHIRSKFLIFKRMVMPLGFLPSLSLMADVCNSLIFNNA